MYQSTRSNVKTKASFAIVKGLASDGGLFVPLVIPKIDIKTLLEDDYITMASKILSLYFTEFSQASLHAMLDKAMKKFTNPQIIPIKKVQDDYFLELFYGPTLAFKDVALSLFPHLYKAASDVLSLKEEKIILVATSGDTGAATLAGFSSLQDSKVIVFYPHQAISPYQEKQMLAYQSSKMKVIAVKGNFDDCQKLAKEMFTLYDNLNSANSINIARLFPQIAYYFYAYIQLVNSQEIKLFDEVNFSVPSGNFGNILAGFLARKMGLPIHKLICASNQNNVLSDFFKTGLYNKKREFYLTNSPSMDILVASNLERLLWFKDPKNTKQYMNDLDTKGEFLISKDLQDNLSEFYASYADIKTTNQTIKDYYKLTSYIMDPHTAVAYKAYLDYKRDTSDTRKTIIVATASYKKFLDSIKKIIPLINEEEILEEDLAKLRIVWNKEEVKDKFDKLLKELMK